MSSRLGRTFFKDRYKVESEPGTDPGFTGFPACKFSFSSCFFNGMPDHCIWNHDQQENKRQWRNTHHRNPASAKVPAHRALQPFCNQVHARQNEQCHEEGKCQSEDNGPGQGFPEYSTVSSKKDMRIQFGKQRYEIDIESDGQRNQCQDGCQCSKQYRDDPRFTCLDQCFSRFHTAHSQYICKFNHQDSILHDNAREPHNTQPGHHR